ncbi:hypothetical protein F5884DRAFT_745119 [Xylogone sp. PMI_703]|nr:hypothetical protein F5884DRAFT_745119 [Xylogone sp. PMI_703]
MPSLTSIVLAALTLRIAQLANAQLFTVSCNPLTIQRSDPIVSPGVASGHVHAVVGGTAFQRTMSTTTAVNAKDSTCDKKLDKSNYWQPQLYHHRSDGQFELIEFQGSAIYYLNRACDYAPGRTTCPQGFNAAPPPAGLRMLSGNPTLRFNFWWNWLIVLVTLRTFDPNSFAQQAIQHVCLRENDSPTFNSLPPMACLRMRAETFFPSCWDGVNLDSADHTSHLTNLKVAFPAIGAYNGGVCPESHPKAIFSVFYEFFYDTSAVTDFNRWVWAMGDPTGYGLHGDFINGWNQAALNNVVATCQGPNGFFDPNCSVNAGQGGAVNLNPEVPAPSEAVGLNGPIAALPGNNPVTGTPIKRARSLKSRSQI